MLKIKVSIIIPHRNSLNSLLKLLKTIPLDSNFEVIIIDDYSDEEIRNSLKKIENTRKIKILYLKGNFGAGFARNVGLKYATGKWLIFADSDDYFSNNFQLIIEKYLFSDNDIIFFKCFSYDIGTEIISYRHLRYNRFCDNWISDGNDDEIKFSHLVPWSKMIKKELVDNNNLYFDEIFNNNDIMFLIKLGALAKKVFVSPDVLYVVTNSNNSLVKNFNEKHFFNKFYVTIEANNFLRSINKNNYQLSVLLFLGLSFNYGMSNFFRILKILVVNRSNLLVGLKKILYFKRVLIER